MDNTIKLSLSKREDDNLDNISEVLGISKSEVVRRALTLFILAKKADKLIFVKDGVKKTVHF